MGSKIKIEVGGVARIKNPIAVVDGAEVQPSYDKMGRQIVVPFQVRELLATAVCTLTNNAADNATTLLAGDAANFLDPYYIYASNASTNAIRIELRDGSGGTSVMALDIGANGVSIIQPPLPYPQSEKGQTWQVDFAVNANIANPNDVTNTTVTVGGFFIKNG